MARNNGKNYSVARNNRYTRSSIANIERHNERKNENYENKDIQLEQSENNFYFKKATNTYLGMFDNMCDENIISTRGTKENAKIIDELIFDVNSAYFENNGGYEFAKEFYKNAYNYAVSKIGGEEYILSAVMHADEKNQFLSEQLGKDIFHYHLHVVYIPVVKKEVLWTKRCKDKKLIGTVKDVITQVSDSKKWRSYNIDEATGIRSNKTSYELLQDEFFQYMFDCGYRDIQRGERGSKEEHLTTTQFKVHQEIERLETVTQKVIETEAVIIDQTDKIKDNADKISIQSKKLVSSQKNW